MTQSTRVYAQAAGTAVYHLRTRNGDHEVDRVVEGPDPRVAAFKVKLTPPSATAPAPAPAPTSAGCAITSATGSPTPPS